MTKNSNLVICTLSYSFRKSKYLFSFFLYFLYPFFQKQLFHSAFSKLLIKHTQYKKAKSLHGNCFISILTTHQLCFYSYPFLIFNFSVLTFDSSTLIFDSSTLTFDLTILLHHNLQNRLVGLRHARVAHPAHIADRIFRGKSAYSVRPLQYNIRYS